MSRVRHISLEHTNDPDRLPRLAPTSVPGTPPRPPQPPVAVKGTRFTVTKGPEGGSSGGPSPPVRSRHPSEQGARPRRPAGPPPGQLHNTFTGASADARVARRTLLTSVASGVAVDDFGDTGGDTEDMEDDGPEGKSRRRHLSLRRIRQKRRDRRNSRLAKSLDISDDADAEPVSIHLFSDNRV